MLALQLYNLGQLIPHCYIKIKTNICLYIQLFTLPENQDIGYIVWCQLNFKPKNVANIVTSKYTVVFDGQILVFYCYCIKIGWISYKKSVILQTSFCN